MDKFTAWVKTAWTDFLSWFSIEEQKFASFLYPVFSDVAQLAEKDGLQDIIAGIPIVAEALTGNGAAAALTAAEDFVKTTVEAQGVTLADTTIGVISNALVAQAQAGLTATATPAASTPPSAGV